MGAIETARRITNLLMKYSDTDLVHQMAALESEVRGLMQQIADKDEVIEQLKKAMQLKATMVCEHSAYYSVDEQGNKTAGPFCTDCYDNKYAIHRLLPAARPKGEGGHGWEWVQCPKCEVPFRSKHAGKYLRKH